VDKGDNSGEVTQPAYIILRSRAAQRISIKIVSEDMLDGTFPRLRVIFDMRTSSVYNYSVKEPAESWTAMLKTASLVKQACEFIVYLL